MDLEIHTLTLLAGLVLMVVAYITVGINKSFCNNKLQKLEEKEKAIKDNTDSLNKVIENLQKEIYSLRKENLSLKETNLSLRTAKFKEEN